MGIPHLWTLVESHGSRQTFKKRIITTTTAQTVSPSPRRWPFNLFSADSRRPTVIDGPSLAYWAYGNALTKREASRSPTIRTDLSSVIPTYKETNEVILAWLDSLGSYGFDIEAIYFDGALPDTKRGERLNRLQSSIGKLLSYRKDTPAQSNEFKNVKRLSSQKGLATPFLVPAAIECLRTSKYRSKVQLVPAEADVFCAEHIRGEFKGYIFSADSDLLVYDLGPNSHVVNLHDMEDWDANDDTLALTSFCSWSIAASLGLKSLTSMAFAIVQDTHARLNAVVETAKRFESGKFVDTTQRKAHDQFVEDYTAGPFTFSSPGVAKDLYSDLGLDPKTLDPRISEWLVQEADPESEETNSYVYLPFLLEDPLQSAAWNSGSLLRQLAYTCYQTRKDGDKTLTTTTIEVYRKGDSASAIELPRLPTDQAALHSKAWIDTLKMFGILPNSTSLSVDGKTSPVQAGLWRALALTVVLRQTMEAGKTMPTKQLIIALLKGHTFFSDWSALHLSAQMQAVLYSFRMLKQILSASFASDQVIETEERALNDHARMLYKQLEQLPDLADLHHAEETFLAESSCMRLVGLISRALGVQASVFGENPIQEQGAKKSMQIQGRKKSVQGQSAKKKRRKN